MLSLFYKPKTISKDAIPAIFELLKISQTPNDTQFLSNPESERTFYNLFFEIIDEDSIPCALTIDWKWHPKDLFRQLEKHLGKEVIALVGSEYVSASLYRIEYSYYGKPQTLLISTNNPNWLLDQISKQLKDRTFIKIGFSYEDSYSWLIVPKDFNVKLFCELTGLVHEKPKLRKEAPKNFTEGYKQTEKLFFSPTIIYVDRDGVGYDMPGQVWAGRVLPGQTIKEGIATELKVELNYTDRFSFAYEGFEGVFKDRKGRNIKRYHLTAYLFDRTFQSKMAGETDIRLEQIPNRTFYHPDTEVMSNQASAATE